MLQGHLESMLLAVLEDGPAHGYAIIDELRRRSRGEFDLPEGTVYPALHRMERTGLLKSDTSQFNGRPRRTYRLSRKGSATLERHRADWREFSRRVSAVLKVSPT